VTTPTTLALIGSVASLLAYLAIRINAARAADRIRVRVQARRPLRDPRSRF
jgi:hypothetical protein